MIEDNLKELKAAQSISHIIDKRVSNIKTGSLTSIGKKTELLERKA